MQQRFPCLPVATVVASVLAWVARIQAIGLLPEPDADALGHIGIARALLVHPTRIELHWVWLPAYHYYLCLLLRLGADAQTVRLINAALAALLPFIVLRYASSHKSEPQVPWLAALFCAVSPIIWLLGISAQQETLFSILIVSCAWAIDTKRFGRAGVLLALASMIRYEAWGAVGLLAAFGTLACFPRLARRLPAPLRASKSLLLVVAPAVLAIFGWFLAHRLLNGSWFGFLRELYRFTHGQRLVLTRSASMEFLWFPVILPTLLFGLALPLAFLGLLRAWRIGFLVPAGVAGFLLLSYGAKGSLGSARYYDALAPFVCLCAAEGVTRVSARRPSWFGWLTTATTACLLVLAVWLGKWTFRF